MLANAEPVQLTRSDNLTFQIQYDIDPGKGSDVGTVNIPVTFDEDVFVFQNSWNPGFNFLDKALNPDEGDDPVNPPSGSFDPFATGLYEIDLVAFFESDNRDSGSGERARSTSNVQVGDAAPATLGLLGLGLLGFAAVRRRRA